MKMKFDEWIDKYQAIPINRDGNSTAPCGILTLDIYGVHWLDANAGLLLLIRGGYIWTYTEYDGIAIFQSGIHHINRQCHFICEVLTTKNLEIEITDL